MKRFHTILTLVAITLLGLAAFTLTACSGDEAEAPAQTKADVLRAKAKEFAKKYGVDMSLNEDNIEQIAEALTVEQMEQDFKNFAELKKSLAQQSLTATTPLKARAKTRGLKIRKSAALKEENPDDEREKIYSGYDNKDVSCTYKLTIKTSDESDAEETVTSTLTGTATISWQYGLKCANWVRASLNLKFGDQNITGESTLSSYFSSFNSFEFSAIGPVRASSYKYTYLLTVSADYHNGQLTVNVNQSN